MIDINYYKNKIVRYNLIKEEVNITEKKLKELDNLIELHNQSTQWIQTKKVQLLSKIIEEIQIMCNKILKEIFSEAYSFKIEVEETSQRKQINFFIVKENEMYEPKFELGGGVIDLLSFCFRIILWSLNPSNNILLLDEPFKFLSKDKHQYIPKLIEELSKKLNIQFIIVTHESEIINSNIDANIICKE